MDYGFIIIQLQQMSCYGISYILCHCYFIFSKTVSFPFRLRCLCEVWTCGFEICGHTDILITILFFTWKQY